MSDQDLRAEDVVKRYSMYAGVAGLIPVPLIDAAAITVLQYNMVREVANAYDVTFHGDRVRTLIGSLIGGAASTSLGYGFGQSYLKGIPGVGPLVAALSMPGAAAAVTWAIGKVFAQHFSLGGTLLDFEPEKTRASVQSHAASRIGR
jgi:uncharacterized protein (DUF697 family)